MWARAAKKRWRDSKLQGRRRGVAQALLSDFAYLIALTRQHNTAQKESSTSKQLQK
jgi:hypothetical protein